MRLFLIHAGLCVDIYLIWLFPPLRIAGWIKKVRFHGLCAMPSLDVTVSLSAFNNMILFKLIGFYCHIARFGTLDAYLLNRIRVQTKELIVNEALN